MSNRCPPVIQIPGVAGSNAFAFVTANFTIPAIGSNVQIQLTNTAPFIAGQDIIIAGPANFQIVSVDNPSQITAKFLGLAGDLISGAVISIGAEVSPTGMPGTNGLAGNNGYATTTSNFTVPSVGSTVVVPVNYSVPFVVGEYVIAPGPANFIVTALPSPTQVTLQFLGNTGDVSPGATIASGSTVASAGSAGQSAFTFLTAQITIPAIGTTVTAAVRSTAWMATGSNVFISANGSGGQGATFQVTTINSPVSVTLTFLGYINDLSPTNTIANGGIVTPTGTQPVTSSTVSAYSTGAVYTLTATPAFMVFGGISPSITLPKKGTWVIFATAVYKTGSSVGTVSGFFTTLLHRTNNSAGNISDSTVVANFEMNSGGPTSSDVQSVIPLFIYTTTTVGDIIQLWVSQTNTSGSTFTTALQASIAAFQIA
jgi:hypothetical protein